MSKRVDNMTALNPGGVYSILKRFFPAKNDDFASDYTEELVELRDFGVTTEEQLVGLLQRHVDEIMKIDRSPMDAEQIHLYAADRGEEFVAHRIRKRFWFSYPALLRIALELEFPAYDAYAMRRDGIVEPNAPPNGGPAIPLGGSEVAEGPPSVS